MHPFAELGPIDPTVTNEFNPLSDDGSARRLGISVEDVKAYVTFIKTTVGITHEDELVRAIEILAQRVHPLALGNVERFISQSRMIARKILLTHMRDADDHIITEIVENLASKLFFHGHPINRIEAKDDLKLKVNVDLVPDLETAMWDLYKDYDEEFRNQEVFHGVDQLASTAVPGSPPVTSEYEHLHAIIESSRLSSKNTTKRKLQLAINPQNLQVVGREDVLEQGWHHSSVP